jgi:serine protease Do
VGADPDNDLAVLQVESDEALPWTPPGSSDDVMPGEPVIAIGNPFGLSNTVTTGVISALDRSIRTEGRVYHGFLQTDASINPGNSGGPLLNAEGALIGINTAIYQGAEGIGFAIPIDAARRVVAELIEHGEVAPVWLGLQFQDLDERLRQVMALPERTRGALVTRVRADGPAGRGGVERGDLVTGVDEHALASAREFYELLARATPGQVLRLSLLRNGAGRTARVVAEEIPGSLVEELASQLLGVELEPHPRGGYAVASVRTGSGSARIGIQPGDVILRINGLPLADTEALERSVLDLRGRSRAILVVQRGRGRYHVTIPLT